MEGPVDAQAQLDEFFGKVVTESAPKRPRTEEDQVQPRRSKGGGYGKGQKGHRRGITEGSAGVNPELIQCICRVLVQHEDSVQVLRQDTAWVWFLRTDQPTIVPQLFQAAEAWRQEANKPAPGLVGRKPLREILFLTILRHLSQNIRKLQGGPRSTSRPARTRVGSPQKDVGHSKSGAQTPEH